MTDSISQAPSSAPRESALQTSIPLPEGPVIVLCHWCSATAVQTDVDITRPGVKAHKTPRVNLCAVWTSPNLPPLDSPLGPLAFGSPAMRRYCGSDDFRDWRDDWEWTTPAPVLWRSWRRLSKAVR